jgi:hypothetical protein
MKFEILMGIPEMKEYWESLCKKCETKSLGSEEKLFKKFVKTINFLRHNPQHNSLSTHEIKALSRRYGIKVWQSYLESKTPSAGRIFWVYGPDKHQITVIGIEPHPEDKKTEGYNKVKLSDVPD